MPPFVTFTAADALIEASIPPNKATFPNTLVPIAKPTVVLTDMPSVELKVPAIDVEKDIPTITLFE